MIPSRNNTTAPMEDFSLGFRTTGSNFAREMTTPKVQNMISGFNKTLRIRPGFDNVGFPGIGTMPVDGLYDYGITQGNRKQIRVSNGCVYKMDNEDGQWDIIQSGLTSGARPSFDTFTAPPGNVLLMANRANDSLQSWDGATQTMTPLISNGAPRGKIVKSWQGHVWVTGLTDYPSRLVYSNLQDHTNYITDGVTNFDDNCVTPDGDYNTGMGLLKGNLYIFKRYHIFRLTYLGAAPFVNVLHVANVGTMAHDTIQEAQLWATDFYGNLSIKDVLVFLTASRDVVAFDGSEVYTLSSAIKKTNNYAPNYMENINQSQLEQSHAIYNRNTKEYTLFTGSATSGTCDIAFSFNTQTNGIYPWTNMNFRSSAMMTTETGESYPILGTYTGEVYRGCYGSKDVTATMVSGIKSLIHFDLSNSHNSTSYITDYMQNLWTVFGTTSVDNSQSKFGNNSLKLDGSTSYISSPTSANFLLSAGIFTIDTQIRTTSLGSNQTIWSQVTDASNYIQLTLLTTGELEFKIVASGAAVVTITTSSAGITTNAWFEIEVVENGNNFYIFVNGVLKGSGTDADRAVAYTGNFEIGRSNLGTPQYFVGWIDEFRILIGTAAHTAGYTASTSAFDTRTYSNVAIAYHWESDLVDLKKPEMMKKGRHFSIYLKPRSTDTITISRATGWEYPFRDPRSYTTLANGNVLGALVLGTDAIGADFGVTLPYDVPDTAQFSRFRISGSGMCESFEIYRMDMIDSPLTGDAQAYPTAGSYSVA